MENNDATDQNRNRTASPCPFLSIINIISMLLMFVLNLYIAYNIILFFMGDGFQFMGGIMLGAAYAITIPVNLFFVFQNDMIKKPDKRLNVLFFIISILMIFIGLILNNATPIWPFISIYGIILLVATIICNKNKKKSQALP
jgi:hypothetical protein